MANSRSSLARFEDIARFAYIADRIQRDRASLREIARDLGVSTTAIRDCVARLQSIWDCPLLVTRQGSAEANQLSAEGTELHKRFATLLRHGGKPDQPINIHFSHSLLTSHLLTPAISSFLREEGEDYRRRLRLRSTMDFGAVINDIQAGSLDVAVAWGLPSQSAKLPRGIECVPTSLKFDLVAICHREDLLDQYVVDGVLHPRAFDELRFVAIDRERQPLPAEAPLDWMHRSDYTEVESFDAVTAFVRSRVGDFGIVPGLYPDLRPFRISAQLFWRKLANHSLQISFYMRQGGKRLLQPDVKRLIEKIESHLNKVADSKLAEPTEETGYDRFPTDRNWYESMRFAYYLDAGRDQPGPVKWKWETVLLHEQPGVPQQYEGLIRNCDDAVFEIKQASHLGNIFFLAAQQLAHHKTPRAVESFVSIFSWCLPSRGIMYGVWGGVDLKARPAAYATVWSHTQLSSTELATIANQASVTLMLNSAESHDFARQPTALSSHLELTSLWDRCSREKRTTSE